MLTTIVETEGGIPRQERRESVEAALDPERGLMSPPQPSQPPGESLGRQEEPFMRVSDQGRKFGDGGSDATGPDDPAKEFSCGGHQAAAMETSFSAQMRKFLWVSIFLCQLYVLSTEPNELGMEWRPAGNGASLTPFLGPIMSSGSVEMQGTVGMHGLAASPPLVPSCIDVFHVQVGQLGSRGCFRLTVTSTWVPLSATEADISHTAGGFSGWASVHNW